MGAGRGGWQVLPVAGPGATCALARMVGARYRAVVCGECVEGSGFVGAVDPDAVARVRESPSS